MAIIWAKILIFSMKKIDVLGHITADYPPTYVMTSYYDFLKENAQPMYEFLKARASLVHGNAMDREDKKYMAHVCHVNMKLEEAKRDQSG